MEILYLILMATTLWPLWLVVAVVVIIRYNNHKKESAAVDKRPAAQEVVKDDELTISLRGVAGRLRVSGQSDDAATVDSAIWRLNQNHPLSNKKSFSSTLEPATQNATSSTPYITSDVANLEADRERDTSSTTAKPVARPDNALTMLYLGGFSFVAATALFVLFADIGFSFKTLLVILASGLLYAGGIYLHTISKRFAQAAVVFVAMGIGSLPFVGLAVYQLLGIDGSLTWLVLSVVAMAMSGYAAFRLSPVLFSNILSLAWLSSAISLTFNLGFETIYLLWTAVVAGLVYYVIAKKAGVNTEVIDAAERSQSIITAVALLGSILFFGFEDAWKPAVTALLTAGTYLVIGIYGKQESRTAYVIAAHILGIGGVVTIAGDLSQSVSAAAITLVIISLVQLMYVFIASKPFGYSKVHDWIVKSNVFVPFIALILSAADYDNRVLLCIVALSMIFVPLLTYCKHRSESMAVAIGLNMLIAPFVIGVWILEPDLDPLMLTLILGAEALLACAIRIGNSIVTWRVIYPVIILVAYMTAYTSAEPWTYGIASIAVGLSLIGMCYIERAYTLIAGVPLMLFIGIAQVMMAFDYSRQLYLIALFVGLVSYAATALLYGKAFAHRMALVAGSIGVLALALYFSLPLTSNYGPIALAVLSLVIGIEGYLAPLLLKGAKMLSAAGLLLSLQWCLAQAYPDLSWVIYAHVWAGYALAGWYLMLRKGEQSSADAFLTGFLTLLTVPVVLSALDDPASGYSLLLLVEQAALVVAGVALHRPLLVKWGAVVATGAIIYMLRDYTYVNLGIISFVLIGYAVYKISRESK